jgi:hypothetical protein
LIRHVLMFKLKPGVSAAQRDEWLEMSRSYDVAVVADFDRLEDVRAHAEHLSHLSAVELSRPHRLGGFEVPEAEAHT